MKIIIPIYQDSDNSMRPGELSILGDRDHVDLILENPDRVVRLRADELSKAISALF